jgi:dynein heavy chain, axonemal
MPMAVAAGVDSLKSQVFRYFIQMVRRKLHVVLCMSHVGDKFLRRLVTKKRNEDGLNGIFNYLFRCRAFSSLINCCTIDWFEEWPESALSTVATSLLHAEQQFAGNKK